MSQESATKLPYKANFCSKRIIELSKPRQKILDEKQIEANMISLEKMENKMKIKRKRELEKANIGKLLQNFENNQNQIMLDQIFKKLTKNLFKEILKDDNKSKKPVLEENRELLIKTAFNNIFLVKPDSDCDLVFQISKVVASFVEPLIRYND